MSKQELSRPFGLYIHWPFCVSKCPYCDFNSHVRNSVDHKRWRDALVKDLHYVGELTKGRLLQSVFFGGGTPSLMEPETVYSLLDLLDKYWNIADVEITLEANPNSIEIAKFKDFKQAGINRVSIGIQSLNQTSLEFLGRAHNSTEAVRAIEIAAQTFDRYSFDLIYALPGQTLKDWKTELSQALNYVRDHISLYQLTIEKGTAFHTAYARQEFSIPGEDLAADLYKLTDEILNEVGINRYEVSNYARQGMECKHNLIYWQYLDYAGIGPGAHGRLTLNGQKFATQCYRAPETWLTNVENYGHGTQDKKLLSVPEQVLEALMMGLRLKEGISLENFLQAFNCDLLNFLEIDRIKFLVKEGYLELSQTAIKTTAEGNLRLNAIIKYLSEPLLINPRSG